MKDSLTLLHYLHKNVEMGITTTEQVIPLLDNRPLADTLRRQQKEYQNILTTCNIYFAENNYTPESFSKMEKISTYLMIHLKTLQDKTDSHIAEMFIQGSTMGIIHIVRHAKTCPNAERGILDLATQLRETEQNNIEYLKQYL